MTYNGKYLLSEVKYYIQYKLFDGESEDCQLCTNTSKIANTFMEITQLIPDTFYRFRVVAVDPYGFSLGSFARGRTERT